jgi:hypothetical protein
MTKPTGPDHEAHPDGSDNIKPVSDKKTDNLNPDRTADNKEVQNERAKNADDFSMDRFSVADIMKANADLQQGISKFMIVDDGETVARSKTKNETALLAARTETVAPESARLDASAPAVKSDASGFNLFRDNGTEAATVAPSGESQVVKSKSHQESGEKKSHNQTVIESFKPQPGKSTLKSNGYHHPEHLSNGFGEYEFTYPHGEEWTNNLVKLTIKEKSGNSHVYEKQADGWHIYEVSKSGTIKPIEPSKIKSIEQLDSGKVTFTFKDNSTRIDLPEGMRETQTPGTIVKTWPDGSILTSESPGTKLLRKPDGHGGFVDTHCGPRPDDEFTITRTADGKVLVREKPGDEPYKPISGDDTISHARDYLTKLVRGRFENPEEFVRFQADMARFESREARIESDLVLQGKSKAEAKRLAHEEISKTYENISRLLTADLKKNPLVDGEKREMIAAQLMRNAATPTLISQGEFKTCNVTALEVRMYSKHPKDASRVVVDMATNGEYVLKNHNKVTINDEAFDNFDTPGQSQTLDGTRNLASQLFQVTAVNIHYAREFGNHKQYEIHKPNPNANPPVQTEVLRENWSLGVFKGSDPELGGNEEAEIGAEITGDQPKEAYIRTPVIDPRMVPIGIDIINSETELQTKLIYARDHGLLPVTIRVHTGNEPFYTDSGRGTAGGAGGWHVVNVTDVENGPPMSLSLDNQWSSKVDHAGQNRLSLDDLYFSMREPDNIFQWAQMEGRRSKGTLSPRQELDLDRQKAGRGWMILNFDDYEKRLKLDLEHANRERAEGHMTPFLYDQIVKQFNSAINGLPPGERFKMLEFEKQLGPTNHDEFNEAIIDTMTRILVDKSKKVKEHTWTEQDHKQHVVAVSEFARLLKLKSLTEKDRTVIEDTVKELEKRLK